MRKPPIDFKAVAYAALQAADRLVPRWLPDGHKAGAEWKARNPTRDDRKAGSFSVNLQTGQWGDFATGDLGGDLVSLAAYLFHGDDQVAAARELAKDLRVEVGSDPAPAQPSKAEPLKARWETITPVPPDAPEPPRAHRYRGLPTHQWAYRADDGAVLGYVCRFETSDGGKEILPVVWARNERNGRTEWRWQQWAEPRPLYGLEHWQDGRPVLVVEGEKCADAARGLLGDAWNVISWPGGGNAVSKADWRPLAGCHVTIWPDADAQLNKARTELLPVKKQPGIKAAEAIARRLLELEATVVIVDVGQPGERPDGWDVADAIADGWTREQVLELVAMTREPAGDDPPEGSVGHLHPTRAPQGRGGSDGGSGGPPEPPDRDWYRSLDRRGDRITPCLANVQSILVNDPAWDGVIAEDLFSTRIVRRKPLPGHGDPAGEWTDIDTSRTVIWLTRTYSIAPASEIVDKAIDVVARANAYHPVRDWLATLEWDGEPRIDVWLTTYLGVDLSEYSSHVGKWFLMAMIQRVLQPGVKFDYCLVLEGSQGLRKSSALAVIAGDWFSDTELDLSNKDSMSAIRGKWLHEFSEMGSIARAESTRQKSFLSRQVDEFRPSYARREIRCPRQLVFAGTTNDWQWQKDPTGGRRFWPVQVTRFVDTDGLLAVRDQLFAEAFELVRKGERFWPTTEEQREWFDPEQLRRESEDPFFDALHDWIEDLAYPTFTMHDALEHALKLDAGRMTRDVTTRVGQQLAKMGCGRQEKRNGVTRFVYTLPPWAKLSRAQAARNAVGDSDGAVPL